MPKRYVHPEEDVGNLKKRKSMMNRYYPIDIIKQILKYLPCKSLVRFKAVSKQWNSFLQKDQVINEYIFRSMRHPSHFLVWDRSLKKLRLYQIGKEERCTRVETKFVLDDYEDMLPSSYGMVCFHNSLKRSLAVYNPTDEYIVKFPNYPKPFDSFQITDTLNHHPHNEHSCHNKLGFGFDPKSRKYKVVQVVRDTFTHGISGCWVLNVGRTKSSWRMIDTAIIDCSIKILEFPICVEGVLYWEDFLYDRGGFVKILLFDLSCEEIEMISSPAKWSNERFDFYTLRLVELQGNLYYVEMTRPISALLQMDIWMLKYSKHSVDWAVLYRLELGSGLRWKRPFIFPLYMNHERIILNERGQLYSYDTNKKSFKICQGFIGGLSSWLYFSTAAIVHSEIIVLLD